MSGRFGQPLALTSARNLIMLHPPVCLTAPRVVLKVSKGKRNDPAQERLLFEDKVTPESH